MGMGRRATGPSLIAVLAIMSGSAPGAAAAAPVTLSWSGLGGQWSEKANWEGGEAPGEAAEPVDLDFPLSACQPDPFGCPNTTDDLAQLTVETVTLGSRVIAFSSKGPGEPPPIAPGPVSYLVRGVDPLTLMHGLEVNTTEEGSGQGLAGSGTTIDLPLVLGAANAWSVGPAPGGLNVWGPVTGDHPLAVALGEGNPLEFAGDTDVGPITISGHSGVFFGGPDANGDLNGTDGEPVELKGGSLWGGGRVGALTIEGAGVEPGFPGSGGKLEVNGDLSLDSASRLTIEDGTPGRTPEEVTATGHAQLGSAGLNVFESCPEPGSTLTLIRARGGVSGQLSDLEGMPIENGQLLEGGSPDGCGAGDPAPALRIEYGAETVTATAEEPADLALPETGPTGAGLADAGQQGTAAYTSSSPTLTVTGPVKVRSRELLVPLRCSSGEEACASVGLRLSVVEHLRDGHVTALSAARGTHRARRTIVLASGRVTLAAGESRTVGLPLDPAAASVAAHRTLHALFTVSYRGRSVRSEAIEIPPPARRRR
jgi:hypothetical protein